MIGTYGKEGLAEIAEKIIDEPLEFSESYRTPIDYSFDVEATYDKLQTYKKKVREIPEKARSYLSDYLSDIKVEYVPRYLLGRGVQGLAWIYKKIVQVARELKRTPGWLERVVDHEIGHIRDPSASELEIRRRTGTLFPSYSIY